MHVSVGIKSSSDPVLSHIEQQSGIHLMIVLFDAVGTVIKPQPSVTEIYFRLGQKHGSRLTREQIGHRIKLGRRRVFNVGQSAESLFDGADAYSTEPDDLTSSESTERELWRNLVFEVFADLDSPDVLFDKLWDHFNEPTNWEIYPDVEACFAMLQSLGIEFGLVSNFDSRLNSIAESVFPLSNCDYVFCSSQVGFRKPSPNFYEQVESAIRCVLGVSSESSNQTLEEFPPGSSRISTRSADADHSIGSVAADFFFESNSSDAKEPVEIIMVGDDYENDCIAPRLAGWKSFWLNRRDLEPGLESEFGAADKQEISSLYEFTHWLLEHVGK